MKVRLKLMAKSLTDDLPELSILIVSIMLVYWVFGGKTAFSYIIVIALSMAIFRQSEIKGLFIDDIVEIFKEE
jgi:hypothetical protein